MQGLADLLVGVLEYLVLVTLSAGLGALVLSRLGAPSSTPAPAPGVPAASVSQPG